MFNRNARDRFFLLCGKVKRSLAARRGLSCKLYEVEAQYPLKYFTKKTAFYGCACGSESKAEMSC